METRSRIGIFRTPADVLGVPKRHAGEVTAGRPEPSYRAFEVLYLTYVVVPIVAGVGMLTQSLASWEAYLTPGQAISLGANASTLFQAFGVVELALGVMVAADPAVGGWLAAAWLWCGAIEMLFGGVHYGLMVCLFCMSLGACAVALMAEDYEPQAPASRVAKQKSYIGFGELPE